MIRQAGEETADWELRDLWDQAQLELDKVRLFGDLATAAFFDGAKPKEREAKRAKYADAIIGGTAGLYRGWLDERRREDPPLAPFHWEIEFPEVFDRETSGFDAIVGNPPFAGRKRDQHHTGQRIPRLACKPYTRSRIATPTWWPTSFAAPSI